MTPWFLHRRRYHGGPPPWWPPNEPWPPRSSRFRGEWRRDRFVRRSGWYTFWPIWILLWIIAVNVMRGRWSAPGGPFVGAAVLLLVCAVAAGTIAVIIRVLAEPVADIVSAAERIKRHDYRARITEPDRGPRWVKDTARAFNAMAQELDAQDQARRHMMADIAHELRTPLTVMQGKIEGLIDGVYPRDTERLQSLLDDVRVLGRLVEDLRTLSTAESGALALSREPTDVTALAHDVVSSLSARAADASIELKAVEAPSAGGSGADGRVPEIDVDPVRIKEVLTNLVTNALRYTQAGGRVSVTVSGQGGGVEVKVSDTGAGIPAADLPRIFDRFYKGAGSSGSGLGLTIARNLVEAHGGSIRAESTPGAGTTMIVQLPRSG